MAENHTPGGSGTATSGVADQPHTGGDDWIDAVRDLLSAIDGNHVLLLPVIDDAGELSDFRIAAAAPGTIDAFGRTADELIGLRLRAEYGGAIHGETWRAFRDAFLDGVPRTVDPIPYPRDATGLPPVRFAVSLRRVGGGLLDSWTRDDDPHQVSERIARTERLANLGWGERDMITGEERWSDQLYRIFERDRAAGPLTQEEAEAIILPTDLPRMRRASDRLAQGRAVDTTFRIQVPSGVKHLRAVTEPVTDLNGRLLRTVGVVQDVTARVTMGTRLALAEHTLSEQQASLAAESLLVAQLQQIILPIPVVPIDLSGLRVAVRYVPAERANRIGGDWFYAEPGLDGSVVVAVGDVAGHGIRAAATMAKLRHAFATLVATATTDPAELLGHLNRLMYNSEDLTDIATAAVARFDPGSRTVQWAQAGHPAPLRTREGTTALLARPTGVMLGVVEDAVYQTATFDVRPGDLLVLYTDGLIEHRDRSLDEGLLPVMDLLNRLSEQGSPQPLVDLLGDLRANRDDDTCVLAFRLLTAQDQPEGADQLAAAGVSSGVTVSPTVTS